jgi:hypothetical protein
MLTHVRNLAGGLVLGSAVLLTPVAPAMAAPVAAVEAQVGQIGLVNVSLLDGFNVAVAVPVQVAANICGVDVAVLSAALLQGSRTTCTNDQTGTTYIVQRGRGR